MYLCAESHCLQGRESEASHQRVWSVVTYVTSLRRVTVASHCTGTRDSDFVQPPYIIPLLITLYIADAMDPKIDDYLTKQLLIEKNVVSNMLTPSLFPFTRNRSLSAP